jgi:Ni/Fe-hydrogenase subunit HybB-like protein
MFWGVQIVLGLAIPVLVLAQPKLAKNGFVAGLMGLFLLVGYAAARILIVVPGQVAHDARVWRKPSTVLN